MVSSRRNRRRARPAPRRRKQQRLGATAVEFAMCANLFFFLCFACIEIARMNMIRNLAQDAAYIAARHVVVPGATAEEAKAKGRQVMGMIINNGYTIDVPAIDRDTLWVDVTVSVNLDEVALLTPRLFGNKTLSTTARMNTERYEHYFNQEAATQTY